MEETRPEPTYPRIVLPDWCRAPLVRQLASVLPRKVIEGASGPYLERYCVGRHDDYNVYLHHILRPDEDEELHNHPWRAVSHIIEGAYDEERLVGRELVWTHLREGSNVELEPDVYHRITSIEGDVWTLFVTGPKLQEWSFRHPVTGVTTPWREFIQSKGLALLP